MDLHISVISDIKQIFAALGHHVVDWSISGHTWATGSSPHDVEVINAGTWRQICPEMCDAFFERYETELSSYDGFIVTHTPCLAMIYERWRKPIIVVASTRYEQPFSDDRPRWEHFNDCLREGIDSGLIVPISNNAYDAAYAELFTQRAWRVIPSLCDYTNVSYQGDIRTSLYWSKYKPEVLPATVVDRDDVFRRRRATRMLWPFGADRRGYKWSDLVRYRAIVHIPYNCSVMSIFEHYAAGIPLFFPSFSFMETLHAHHRRDGVLSELSFNQVFGLPPRSIIPCGPGDPNDYENTGNVMELMKLADYYDTENMPFLQYFDSFEHLSSLLDNLDARSVSEAMKIHGAFRRQKVHAAWREVLGALS